MKASGKQNIARVFYPDRLPDAGQRTRSWRIVVTEGAVAGIIYSVATANFMQGYFSYLGASLSMCALISVIPSAGCILQLFSPFVFERWHHRKLPVLLLCALFRFSVAGAFLCSGGTAGKTHTLGTAVLLYTIAFLAAGFVTPGLSVMILELAPMKNRGTAFAVKNVAATVVNAVATLLLGRMLDHYIAEGLSGTGYFRIGLLCLLLAAVDAALIAVVYEVPSTAVTKIHFKDLLRPVRDDRYRPLFLFFSLNGFANGIATPFLIIYQLDVLHLSHSYITTVGVVSAALVIAGSFFFGWLADVTSWAFVMKITTAMTYVCTLLWAFVSKESAVYLAPFLIIGTAVATAGSGISNQNLQFFYAPQDGKTTYFGVQATVASLLGVAATAIFARLQAVMEIPMGDRSVQVLFLAGGIAGLLNLWIFGRKAA